jgi:large subunit ribosomal protein L17
MRHGKAHRKLGRTTAHRTAMFANMAASLIKHEQIVTTLPKAKELRPVVEKMITLAKRGDLSARRAVVAQFPNEPLVVAKLFDEIAPKYADRSSGFTRIVRLGQRRGDAAEIVQIELV